MSEARLQRYALAKPIALAALDMDITERESYLTANCGDDEALREEVRWMLEAAEVITGNADLLLPLLEDVPDDAGSSVYSTGSSQYRILWRLGEGGMGVVYLAERVLDEGTPSEGISDQIRQLVALKFLNATGMPGELRRRFAEERRILATLNHPNIAHLIDAGTIRDGRPFLALEYVQGERIDEWCESRRLSLRERVTLFLKVCAAVQYAHQQLVIHRDIKPANILVTADGEPKLLDFGIARLLDHVDGVATARTTTMQRALTIAYASPEQVRGLPLGTAADVWSLGVVLYQLVCGVRPFGGRDVDGALDVSNAIVTGRLVSPSRQLRHASLETQQVVRAVPTDIDAIAMKALRSDPAKRYASVGELGDDLRRFLAARPVRARQGRNWYRARLFTRRHRLGLGVAALLMVLLGAFAMDREAQLRRMEIERDKTQAIAGFLQELFENADPTHAHGSHVTVREVLDSGSAQLMSRKDISSPVRVNLLLSMARSYNQLSLGGQAIPLLKQARELQHTYGASALERGEVLAALGRAYSTVIDLASAIPVDQESIALLSQAPGDHADEILRVRINLLYNQLGVLDVPLAQVVDQIQQIVTQLETRAKPDPELHVQALAVLSMARASEGQDQAAIAAATRALDEADRLYVKDDPTRVYYNFTLALVSMRADPAGAVQRYRQAIADYDHMVGTPGPGLAGLLSYFGGALGQMGQSADAVLALERAAHMAQSFAADSPDFYLGTLNSLAQQYIELGRDADAEALLKPQLPQLTQRVASHSVWATTNAADALNVLGTVALDEGRASEAMKDFQQAASHLGAREQQISPDSYAASLAGQGEAALAIGQNLLGAQQLTELDAFNLRSKAAPTGWPMLDAVLLRGGLDIARGDFRPAAALVTSAIPLANGRWGACSRRSVALWKLVRTAQAHGGTAADLSPPACATMTSMAMH
ncbi:MAG: serine/threonine-protein kinase [Rhodanobacter sp.]